ncbi:hypothetical protein [Streptomyces sp. NPDC002884]|uniref:hypothetical protein n=1 Tax=Streptomyces sp. NPDC002884 TaxID=3154544 RepID=UPI003325DE50
MAAGGGWWRLGRPGCLVARLPAARLPTAAVLGGGAWEWCLAVVPGSGAWRWCLVVVLVGDARR